MSIVGWSLAIADANSDAPIRSPAPIISVFPSPPAARSCSTVPAHFTVLALIRPWKSLTPSRFNVTSDGGASATLIPTSSGLWSEAPKGFVWSKNCVAL